jgi:hypothetical protein
LCLESFKYKDRSPIAILVSRDPAAKINKKITYRAVLSQPFQSDSSGRSTGAVPQWTRVLTRGGQAVNPNRETDGGRAMFVEMWRN